jgi:hypothetical protein
VRNCPVHSDWNVHDPYSGRTKRVPRLPVSLAGLLSLDRADDVTGNVDVVSVHRAAVAQSDRQWVKAHDFRRRAMTEAWKLGLPKAAVAFGCNPMTMRAHSIALDETAVSDEVLTAIAGTVRAPTTSIP